MSNTNIINPLFQLPNAILLNISTMADSDCLGHIASLDDNFFDIYRKVKIQLRFNITLTNSEINNSFTYFWKILRIASRTFIKQEKDDLTILTTKKLYGLFYQWLQQHKEQLTTIRELKFTGTKKYPKELKFIPPELSYCETLRSLSICHTSLQCVYFAKHWFESMTFLDLGNNLELEDLPDSICKLKNLRILYLNKTSIKQLPKEFYKLENLYYLNLSCNKNLLSLPDKMQTMDSLEYVSVKKTNFQAKDIWAMNLPKLLEVEE